MDKVHNFLRIPKEFWELVKGQGEHKNYSQAWLNKKSPTFSLLPKRGQDKDSEHRPFQIAEKAAPASVRPPAAANPL